MPVPDSPTGRSDVASSLLRLFAQLHDQVRGEIDGLDDAALNWVPTPGANSIATIVTHLVGSEAETLRCVAGVPVVRDRDDEFSPGRGDGAEVRRQLDAADELIADLRPRMGRNMSTLIGQVFGETTE